MTAEKSKIGIMGVGMVGSTLKNYFQKKNKEIFLYDPPKGFNSLEEINKAEIIFICVPTPFDKEKGFDLSAVDESCSKIKGEKIIVIKSTVLPGSTEKIQEKYKQHKILFNPEFLTESTAQADFENPDRQIIGYTSNSKEIAGEIMDILPRALFEKIIPSKEAEMVKYFSNTFYAVKVIFANQMYELCRKTGIDYEIVRECASADKMIGANHLDVHHKGYLGYGGKCLPKDMRSLIEFGNKNGTDLKLHKVVEEINNQLMKRQGRKED